MEVRILIAEPDDTLRDVFERYLSRRGFLVETAGTLGECIEKAVAFGPDVIMSELDFSDGSDDQAFRSMLQCSATAVPIVVVTRQSRESGTQFGWPVAEYFEKPVPMARLAEALRNCAKHPDVSVA
jgi:DNA-binding response OmpR family regulator